MILGRNPETGYVWLRDPNTDLGSSGASRVETGQTNPPPKLPPLGFVKPDEYVVEEADPTLWEGDQT